MDNILKIILMVPQSTPREALYIETGLLDPEAIRLKKQSANGTQNEEWHKPENEKVHNKQQHNHKMGRRNKKGKTRAGHRRRGHEGRKNICEAQSKPQNKRVVQGKNRKRGQQQIQSSTPIGRDKKNWEPPKRANHMKKITRPQASTIFKARSRMLPVKTTTGINTKPRHAEGVATTKKPNSMS